MPGVWLFAMTVYLGQAPSPATVEDELRRAKNEYAYGNYDEAVRRLRDLLYPTRLTTDEQLIEAHKYLALSYYLLDRLDEVGEEFAKLLYLDPDYELDAFTVAPPIIEMFESIRKQLAPELDVIRQRKSQAKLTSPHMQGYRRVIETRTTERSELATLLPFGIGQFQNGDTGWGVVFLVSELALLATNIASYAWAYQIAYPPKTAEDKRLAQTLTVTQYAGLALFGVVWSVGVFQARLHFVPTVEAPPQVRDEPLSGATGLRAPGFRLTVRF